MYYTDAVGERYERVLKEDFPDWERTDSGRGGIVPDFLVGEFWVEAKAGYWNNGVRIKREQVRGFPMVNGPVVYAIGYHNFYGASTRLPGKSDEKIAEILDTEMMIEANWIVSSEIVNAIWGAENKTSGTSGINYCMLKQRFLRDIVEDNSFTRNGEEHDVKSYYGVDRSGLLLVPPERSIDKFPYGFILDKDEGEIINYFKERGLIPQ